MNWKEFLKPNKWKIIAFLLIIFIFGIPVTTHSCSTYPLMAGELPPPCVDRLGFQNIFYMLVEMAGSATDVYIGFKINYLYLIGYLILVYFLLSILFYFFPKKHQD
jgi:hypothetical protein